MCDGTLFHCAILCFKVSIFMAEGFRTLLKIAIQSFDVIWIIHCCIKKFVVFSFFHLNRK